MQDEIYNWDNVITKDPIELKQQYHSFENHKLHIENGDFLTVDCYLCKQDTCPKCQGKIYINDDNSECSNCENGRIEV